MQHVDWMALNGINMPLATTGQEAVQRQVYLQLGLSEKEIDSYFTGPAFLPWGRMGNIKSWGGPLRSSWDQRSIALQHSILGQMRSLGMTPVLPGFAGHVPDALLRIYPDVSYQVQSWLDLGFSCNNTCTILLDPRDPVFKEVGVRIMDDSRAEFGTDHLYSRLGKQSFLQCRRVILRLSGLCKAGCSILPKTIGSCHKLRHFLLPFLKEV